MTVYSLHPTAESEVQLGKRKETCSGFKMLPQTYLYWVFLAVSRRVWKLWEDSDATQQLRMLFIDSWQ